MDEHKPWRPHIEHLPLFNPFEPSTEWTRQNGAGDEIKIEDASEATDETSGDAGKDESDKK
ncbi:MAG: hypothetical protein IT480_15485 [Gammaproteobacteria bacterium]|nr:hypothetical protein [Gammaproteobacteria bacterium]